MGSESLTTAILGLNDTGRSMLKAAASTGLFQIKAVADQDQQKAEKAAVEYGCEAYTDYRQLVVQNQLDCLLVAAETHTCDEQIQDRHPKEVQHPQGGAARQDLRGGDGVRAIGPEREGAVRGRQPGTIQGRLHHGSGSDRPGPARTHFPDRGLLHLRQRGSPRLADRSSGRGRRRAAARLLPGSGPDSLELPAARAGLCPQDQPRPRQTAATVPDGRHRHRLHAVQRRLHGQPRGHPMQRESGPAGSGSKSTAKKRD